MFSMDVLWLLKEINRLFNYRNIKYLCKSYYGEKVIYSKLQLSKFKNFISGSVFGKLQLTQISLNSRRNQKWKITHTVLGRWTLPFSSYKNRELKVEPWLVGARQRKKSEFFVTHILFEGNFLTFAFYLNV